MRIILYPVACKTGNIFSRFSGEREAPDARDRGIFSRLPTWSSPKTVKKITPISSRWITFHWIVVIRGPRYLERCYKSQTFSKAFFSSPCNGIFSTKYFRTFSPRSNDDSTKWHYKQSTGGKIIVDWKTGPAGALKMPIILLRGKDCRFWSQLGVQDKKPSVIPKKTSFKVVWKELFL